MNTQQEYIDTNSNTDKIKKQEQIYTKKLI